MLWQGKYLRFGMLHCSTYLTLLTLLVAVAERAKGQGASSQVRGVGADSGCQGSAAPGLGEPFTAPWQLADSLIGTVRRFPWLVAHGSRNVRSW